MFPAALYARVHFCLRKSHARPRVQQAPGLPCALYFEVDEKLLANLGQFVSRDRVVILSRRHPRKRVIQYSRDVND